MPWYHTDLIGRLRDQRISVDVMVSYRPNRTVKFLFCFCNASNAGVRGSAIITVKPVPTATNVLPSMVLKPIYNGNGW